MYRDAERQKREQPDRIPRVNQMTQILWGSFTLSRGQCHYPSFLPSTDGVEKKRWEVLLKCERGHLRLVERPQDQDQDSLLRHKRSDCKIENDEGRWERTSAK